MQHGEECAGLDELARTPERILIDCLRALDGGASTDDCVSRYPQQEDSLRGFLAIRAQLLTLKTTAPSPTTFGSGREALLARVVRPLASSHPGSTETQGRQARGLLLRPATRVAFAGALLFAMAGCALGVSATPGVDKAREALPSLPSIPHQQPPYPFPKFNQAPPSALPTAEPSQPSNDAAAGSATAEQPQAQPTVAPSDATPGAAQPQPEPTKPANPSDGWLPPVNAHENDPLPDATATPGPTAEPDDADDSQNSADSSANTPTDEANEPVDTNSQDNGSSQHGHDGNSSAHDGASQNATPDNSSATDSSSSDGKSQSSASSSDNIVWPDATLAHVAPPS